MMEAYGNYPYAHGHLSEDGSQNYTNGFSRGSSTSFGYPDYRYFVDRGEVGASRLCPTSLVDNNALDAAGIGFAGNPSSSSNTFVIPEDISVYNQWNWSQPDHPILAPAPVYPQPSAFSVKSTSSVCSPTAQLPTPAAMAVLLNPNAQLVDQQQQQIQAAMPTADFEIPQGSAIHTARPAIIRPVEPVVAVQGVPDSPSREKKHACTMCHKRQAL
jgi:hypothetical protein